jgi:3-hydroxybutyryl-CoA dehydrogenase
MKETEKVAVIGAGTMGNGIAHVFAQTGHEVVLIDLDEARLAAAQKTIGTNLERQVKRGTITMEVAANTLARITTATALGAAANADLAIEAVSEDLALKARIFAELDEVAPPEAILASNTSSISITALAGATRRPEQVIGMHFMNPVPVMKLVEVIRGLQTSDETAASILALAERLEKTPVEANDFPGFVSNRVLMPMINEAIFCLMEGVAEAEAIDTVMKLGMNHPMGPLALADLIGLDTCLAILEVLQREIGDDKYRPCPLLRNYVAAGWLGRKTGRGFYRY